MCAQQTTRGNFYFSLVFLDVMKNFQKKVFHVTRTSLTHSKSFVALHQHLISAHVKLCLNYEVAIDGLAR